MQKILGYIRKAVQDFDLIQKGDKILRTDVSKKISRKEPASCDKIKKKIKF